MKKIVQATLACLLVLLWNATFIALPAMASPVATPSVTPTLTFSNPNPGRYNFFGYSVAIDGEAVVIGAYGKDVGAVDAGTTYLFNKNTGELLQTFSNPNPGRYDHFGRSVAIDGEAVVIGALRKNTGVVRGGEVYLFNKMTGELQQTFSNPNPGKGDDFGNSIAIDGETVVIGALRKDSGAKNAGGAYLFNKNTGQLQQTFSNPNPAKSDNFGKSVAIDGEAVVIGALRKDAGALNTGAAYLFNKSTGELLQTFSNPNPVNFDYFGNSVAIDEEAVLIGAYGKDAGVAYLFNRTTGELLQTFSNPNPALNVNDYFGISVDINGEAVVIGAVGKDAGAIRTGAAYLFNKSTGELQQTFSNPNPVKGDYFGISVAMDGEAVVIGAFRKNTKAVDAGLAYLYTIDNPTVTTNTPQTSTPEDNTPKPAPAIVNIDAKQNNKDNPVIQPLTAGIYKIRVISTSEGGKFDAYNTVGLRVRGCDRDGLNCSNGWETRYYYKSPGLYKKLVDKNCTKLVYGGCRYSTAAQAAANYPEDVELAILKDKDVNFYIYDSDLRNNQGGISLEITFEREVGKK